MFSTLIDVGNQRKVLINKIFIIFSPSGKFSMVAYKGAHFEMIRLFLNIDNTLCFSFFHFTHKTCIQVVTTFLALDLVMVLKPISMFKTLNKCG